MTTSSQQQFDDTELARADEINSALDAMKNDVSPAMFSADPSFQTLVRLHIQTSDREVDEEFVDEVEELLLTRFANNISRRAEEPVRHSFWRIWTMPLVSLAIVAGVVVGISSDAIPFNIGALRDRLPMSFTNTDTNAPLRNANTVVPVNTDTVIIPKTSDPLPSVVNVPGLAALGIEKDMADIELVKKDVENTMSDMEALATEVDALNNAHDVGNILNDFESINL